MSKRSPSRAGNDSWDEDSEFEDEDRQRSLNVEDLLQNSQSPGLFAASGFDVPILREKQNFGVMETIITAIVNGCIFGKLCLTGSKEPRTWLYSTVALTDTFLVSFNKNDVFKMVENQRRRVLQDQMNFFKNIPSPEFTLLSKKKL